MINKIESEPAIIEAGSEREEIKRVLEENDDSPELISERKNSSIKKGRLELPVDVDWKIFGLNKKTIQREVWPKMLSLLNEFQEMSEYIDLDDYDRIIGLHPGYFEGLQLLKDFLEKYQESLLKHFGENEIKIMDFGSGTGIPIRYVLRTINNIKQVTLVEKDIPIMNIAEALIRDDIASAQKKIEEKKAESFSELIKSEHTEKSKKTENLYVNFHNIMQFMQRGLKQTWSVDLSADDFNFENTSGDHFEILISQVDTQKDLLAILLAKKCLARIEKFKDIADGKIDPVKLLKVTKTQNDFKDIAEDLKRTWNKLIENKIATLVLEKVKEDRYNEFYQRMKNWVVDYKDYPDREAINDLVDKSRTKVELFLRTIQEWNTKNYCDNHYIKPARMLLELLYPEEKYPMIHESFRNNRNIEDFAMSFESLKEFAEKINHLKFDELLQLFHPSSHMNDEHRRKMAATYADEYWEKVKIPALQHDIIYGFFSYHHIKPGSNLLKNLKKCLKPHGYIILLEEIPDNIAADSEEEPAFGVDQEMQHRVTADYYDNVTLKIITQNKIKAQKFLENLLKDDSLDEVNSEILNEMFAFIHNFCQRFYVAYKQQTKKERLKDFSRGIKIDEQELAELIENTSEQELDILFADSSAEKENLTVEQKQRILQWLKIIFDKIIKKYRLAYRQENKSKKSSLNTIRNNGIGGDYKRTDLQIMSEFDSNGFEIYQKTNCLRTGAQLQNEFEKNGFEQVVDTTINQDKIGKNVKFYVFRLKNINPELRINIA